MLVSLVRVGASRQSVAKAVVLTGADHRRVVAEVRLPTPPVNLAPAVLEPDARQAGLIRAGLDGVWLGTHSAREEVFSYLGAVLAALANTAREHGATVAAPGIQLGTTPAVAAGDVHALRTVDTTEQEVLTNLLRRHSPVLIALAGRATIGPTQDRIGSRWLADSREHLATRYLASADPRHLHHVKADLRRRDGIADLTRMDVAPRATEPAEVLVRCLDGQVSLADLRAHAVLLAALALHARRLVKTGRREGNVPQTLIEGNRARAITHGLRARFTEEADRRPVQATRAARRLLEGLLPVLSLLEATAEELIPVLAPLELPEVGLPPLRTQDLMAGMTRQGEQALARQAEYELCDPRPGGGLLHWLRTTHPGRTELVLDKWRTALADGGARRKKGGK
ncbi:hypothetical protein [Nonomuraea cavernae]|uniref:Uncharacterized protein n=1 Tax=Nonomuraea cavernae TaxID=2045107 RepID=A0A917YTH3_9ACTN|nr:hypothetical protein [Nonomuraea cavernae]MCA2185257.1 hypothetical protein [Nonomuraea cavernae]GGO65901.1 hypothetical protein GCM10012289_18700 [Nonomuraea cavernae]